jgi:hypothetical protein
VDGEAGDGVDGDGLPPLGASLTDPAGDADCLGGVREQPSLCQSDDLDGPALVTSMATVILGVHDEDFRQGRSLTWKYGLVWFFFTTRM